MGHRLISSWILKDIPHHHTEVDIQRHHFPDDLGEFYTRLHIVVALALQCDIHKKNLSQSVRSCLAIQCLFSSPVIVYLLGHLDWQNVVN